MNKMMLGVYSHLIVIVVGYIASLFFPKPVIDKNLLLQWLARSQAEENKALYVFSGNRNLKV
jgi:SSS family solute:Na+ symporter